MGIGHNDEIDDLDDYDEEYGVTIDEHEAADRRQRGRDIESSYPRKNPFGREGYY